MTIMSPLLTVAMVTVSATAGPAPMATAAAVIRNGLRILSASRADPGDVVLSGLGRAIAHLMSKCPYRVVVVKPRFREAGDALAQACGVVRPKPAPLWPPPRR